MGRTDKEIYEEEFAKRFAESVREYPRIADAPEPPGDDSIDSGWARHIHKFRSINEHRT